MNHAITVGLLLKALAVVIGAVTLGFGGLMFMAGGMSDAPAEGEQAGRTGCIVALVGAALIGVGLFA